MATAPVIHGYVFFPSFHYYKMALCIESTQISKKTSLREEFLSLIIIVKTRKWHLKHEICSKQIKISNRFFSIFLTCKKAAELLYI